MAGAFSQAFLDEKLTRRLDAVGRDRVAAWLAEGAAPLLRYDVATASKITLPESRRYLVMADCKVGRDLAERVSAVDMRINMHCEATTDPFACGVLGVHNLLPLSTLAAYAEAQVDYYASPQLHVFPAEQAAVQREKQQGKAAGLFHPLFVRLLEQESLVTLFSLCYIYGFVQMEGGRYVLKDPVPQADQAGLKIPLKVSDLLAGLEAFALLLPHTAGDDHPMGRRTWRETTAQVTQAVDAFRAQLGAGRYAYLDAFLDRRVKGLEESQRPEERDFATYLRLLVEDERMA